MPETMETKQLSSQLTTADLANAANGRDLEERAVENRGQGASEDAYSGPLLPRDYSDDMRTRWEAIQTGFVDDPRVAVQHADELVASAIKKLAESFAGERAKLEDEWSKGKDVSIENLRQALRRYRAFFHRLLSI
jgi:hypothetical protein